MHRSVFSAVLLAAFALPAPAEAIELNEMLRRSPLITINRTPAGAFESVTVVSLMNAPFDQVWEAILDFDAYSSYMPRVEESKVLQRSADGREITARFEIEVPLSNTKYTLKFVADRERRVIDVQQVAGDLRGSSWRWRFEPRETATYVIYSGRLVNFSRMMEGMDDEDKTISIGINISSLLATVKSIRERAEALAQRLPARPAAPSRAAAGPVPAAPARPAPAVPAQP